MVETVGHRGAAAIWPENTLAGFTHAIDLGVDYVECDVHLTWDGELVVMHDERVDRTTNGTGAVASMTLETIRRLDAGRGLQVPTLNEVLDCVKGRVHLLCELKGEGVETAAVAAVRSRNMSSEVTFSCFDISRLEKARMLGEDLRLAAILGDIHGEDFARARALQVSVVDVHYRGVSLDVVDTIHAAGMELCAWNPDTVPEQQLMMALGADRVSSNRPDILLQAVHSYRAA